MTEKTLCICLDGATHTAVLLDEHGKPVRNSMYWTDRRSQRESDYLKEQHYDLFLQKTYNIPSPLWTLPQLMWLRDHEGTTYRKTRHILFTKDYIRYRLTGVMVTDSIEAMGAMLFDLETNDWSSTLCSFASVDPSALPPVADPADIVGKVSGRASLETALHEGIPVIAGATDTAMEVFASGTISCGQATIKLATAGRICVITERAVRSPMLVTYKHLRKGFWYPGSANKSCAASYRWFRDVFGDLETQVARQTGKDAYALLDHAAQSVAIGCDNLFFHPYLQGEATPYMDNSLRSSFTGMTSFHTKGHFARAVLEGVGYSLFDSLSALRELGLDFSKASIIGGGAKSPLWRQIIADILGVELRKMRDDDSSFGSAMFAGVAIGVFSSFEDCLDRCTEVVETTMRMRRP